MDFGAVLENVASVFALLITLSVIIPMAIPLISSICTTILLLPLFVLLLLLSRLLLLLPSPWLFSFLLFSVLMRYLV